MAGLAAVLSVVMIDIDRRLGSDWLAAEDWLHGNQPEAAQLLLSIIAGSMLGVAGVTFSVTIAAVAYASSQFGPRIVTNYMRDRINQVTLGTFVATFLYCLLVLRKVQPGDGGVPHLSLLVGMGFAIASICVLIEFIHHISDSIHANSAMAALGRELREAVIEIYPEPLPPGAVDDAAEGAALPPGFACEAIPIVASESGYVQAVSEEALLEVAVERDLTICILRAPGDFAAVDRAVAYAWPPQRVDEDAIAAIQNGFAYGRRRTPHQDLRLPLDQLVEMAWRSLSPAVIDPVTATGCLNWLGATLSAVARRRMPPAARRDAAGISRLVIQPLQFADLAEAVFGRLRPYFAGDRNASFAMMRVIGAVLVDALRPEDKAVLLMHASRLAEDAGQRLLLPDDRAALEHMLQDVKRLADLRSGPLSLEQMPGWMRREA